MKKTKTAMTWQGAEMGFGAPSETLGMRSRDPERVLVDGSSNCPVEPAEVPQGPEILGLRPLRSMAKATTHGTIEQSQFTHGKGSTVFLTKG